jgi:O-antigen ligase
MIPRVNGYGHQASGVAAAAPANGIATLGRNLYLVFVASWFLHLGARVPTLGAIRIDLILVVILTVLAFAGRSRRERVPATPTDRMLRVLIVYVLVTIPFVEWPGSVLRYGIPEFAKAIVFYYFTVAFIRNESDVKALVSVFLVCQLYRVLEPLYLHLVYGYWGSAASMLGGTEFLNRLSGSPSDVVNPNGLAAVICTLLLFLYYMAGLSWLTTLAFLGAAPACLYALSLTGSRTGLLSLLLILAIIVLKSRHRLGIGAAGIIVLFVGFQLLSADQQDRYLSTFGAGERNQQTADDRFDNLGADLEVGLRRPIFGHGLGTSREANANFGARNQLSHNLYLELFQELGLVGLAIFLVFLGTILGACANLRRAYAGADAARFLPRLGDALQVWLGMNLLSSLASYGLSDYWWYLLAALAVVVRRLAASPAKMPESATA